MKNSLTRMIKRSSNPHVNYRRKYQKQDNLTNTQKILFENCLLGCKALPKDYLDMLSDKEINEIIYKSNEAHKILNILRQQKLSNELGTVIRKFVPDYCGGTGLLDSTLCDPNFIVEIEDIQVPQHIVIEELIKNNLLPTDFYQL